VLIFAVALAGAYLIGRADPADRPTPSGRGGAMETGRGRDASSPAQIPARGWFDILKRTWNEMQDDRLLLVAAGVVFYALLALFPAMSAMISLYGLVADPATVREHIGQIAFMLPDGSTDILREQADRVVSTAGSTLSLALIVSIALALWSANSGMKAVIDGLNVVYEEDETRSFLTLNAVSLTLTLGAMLFVLLAIGAIVMLPGIIGFLDVPPAAEAWIQWGRWPLFFVAVVVGLAVLYRFGPSRAQPRFSWVTPGSVAAALLWVVGSALLSYYISRFGNYEATYGSLGAVIGLMIWLWLTAIVVLFGGELNAELEHQTAEDTTQGQAQPLGGRRARMADSIGSAQ
jgi:membrane protein